MNEQATLRFEFVSSGGGGLGPAGVPAPSQGGQQPASPKLPDGSPSSAKDTISRRGDSSIVEQIKGLLSQSGLKSVMGPVAPFADAALEAAGKIEKAASAIGNVSATTQAASRAAPIVPVASSTAPVAAGAARAAIPTAAAVAGSGIGAVAAVAGAVVGSAAFAGMIAKAANGIAAANSPFSPQVAVANALAEVRTIRRQVELGQRLGADVAGATEAYSRIEDNLIRGSEREISSWSRLWRAALESGETASEAFRRAGGPTAIRQAAGSTARGLGLPAGVSSYLEDPIGFISQTIETVDRLARIALSMQSREQRRANEERAQGAWFSGPQFLPLPDWVTGGKNPLQDGSGAILKFNGPVMWNP